MPTAFSAHPEHLWREPEPKAAYDVVIVGGGGHGLATAYYLAHEFGIRNVAVLERGWLAGGNMARNTTIIRSNYLSEASAAIYEHALTLWEGLAEALDYDLMFSQRGVLNLAHTPQEVRESVRRVGANRLSGIDAHWLDPQEVAKVCPIVDVSPARRYPVLGATFQPRAGRSAPTRSRAGGSGSAGSLLSPSPISGCTSATSAHWRYCCPIRSRPSPDPTTRSPCSAG